MYTDPQIVSSNNLETRAYIKVYIDGQRYRLYNGKPIEINCNPNNTRSLNERNRLLFKLQYELIKKLEAGWRPCDQKGLLTKTLQLKTHIGKELTLILDQMKGQDFSESYKRDIRLVGNSFILYLREAKLFDIEVKMLTSVHIEDFLKQFNHSSTYYMNKRRTLSGILSRLVTKKLIADNPVQSTSKLKEKASLHQAYTKQQLKSVLAYLETNYPNLHLCALIMYGCFLRPHQEIRNLRRKEFNESCTVISLAGRDNKSGRIRTVHVPSYVRELLERLGLDSIAPEANLFTGTTNTYNASYFNTMWSRVKEKLIRKGVIGNDHTLYSFRHTAAINLYMKTKDIFKVQQAMGHSTMSVTLTYMRSLGILNAVTAEDIPDL